MSSTLFGITDVAVSYIQNLFKNKIFVQYLKLAILSDAMLLKYLFSIKYNNL